VQHHQLSTKTKLDNMKNSVIVYKNSTDAWYVNQRLHRTDGPAIIRADGSQVWCVNGRLHRTDGPAFIHTDGSQEWYLNDRDLTNQITAWMAELDITHPFNEEHQALFLLTFC
jgi:hypothetical protein